MSSSFTSLSLNESPARMGVDAIELGQRWAQFMPKAEALYDVAPTCEARKIARGNSRRAWLLETCSYSPANTTLAEKPVQLVRHYFINQELLRIDIGLVGAEAELAAVVRMLGENYGPGKVSSEDGASVTRWQLAMDEAAVRIAAAPAAGSEASLVMLYLRDVKAAEEARAIAGW